MFNFLRILILFFEKNNIPNMLPGSVTMSTYILPGFTSDFEIKYLWAN